jgi:hypothetical protein
MGADGTMKQIGKGGDRIGHPVVDILFLGGVSTGVWKGSLCPKVGVRQAFGVLRGRLFVWNG